MKMHRGYTVLALAALLVAGAGCSKKSTAPRVASDPLAPGTRAGIASIHAALSSPTWSRLDGLSFAPAPAPSAAAVRALLRAAQPVALQSQQASGALVRDVAAGLATRLAAPNAVVIPPDVRGTTWVFDPGQHKYVQDPDRSGAPDNGVRYILYAMNPLTHEPVVNQEIGYADLTDEGTDAPNSAALRLRAVSGDVVFVDYSVSLAGAANAGQVGVHGTFFDNAKHLDFDIQVHAESAGSQGSLDLHALLAVPEDDCQLSTDAHAAADAAAGTSGLAQEVTIGDHTFAIAAAASSDEANASVAVDGSAFARIHATSSVLVVVGADGKPLSAGQRQALGQIFGLFDQLCIVITRLLQPVGVLFALVPTV